MFVDFPVLIEIMFYFYSFEFFAIQILKRLTQGKKFAVCQDIKLNQDELKQSRVAGADRARTFFNRKHPFDSKTR